MKLADIVTRRLMELGVEKPSARLVEGVENLVLPKVIKLVKAKVSSPLVARAFAATLSARSVSEGDLGDAPGRVPQASSNMASGPYCVACQSPENAPTL